MSDSPPEQPSFIHLPFECLCTRKSSPPCLEYYNPGLFWPWLKNYSDSAPRQRKYIGHAPFSAFYCYSICGFRKASLLLIVEAASSGTSTTIRLKSSPAPSTPSGHSANRACACVIVYPWESPTHSIEYSASLEMDLKSKRSCASSAAPIFVQPKGMSWGSKSGRIPI